MGILQPSVFVAFLVLASAARAAYCPRLPLRDDWQLQTSHLADQSGAEISTVSFRPQEWYPTSVPSTVLNALIKNGVYPDLRIGLNAHRIPDSSDTFNERYALSRFSHLPDQRNPWHDPWWFRREFILPAVSPGQRVGLNFDAINYRAEVWLNGRRIADSDTMAGMFQRFRFDVTDRLQAGKNVLAVKVFPVDHPGTPDAQLDVLGKDRGYVDKAIMYDVTEIMTIGYDCMMTVPDRNMGLWQEVWLDFTGPVDLRDPFIVTDLPLPDTSSATLSISTELVNGTTSPVRGVLRGHIAGTEVSFEQPVELGPSETKLVNIDPKPVMRNPRLWWPVNYGEQYLYDMILQFDIGGQTSDTETVAFGVRESSYEMHEIDGWHGRRVLINGKRIFCRGGYIQPELLFDWDAPRMEAEIRYYAEANLNLIYFEDIPNPPRPFLGLCDRYGILFGNVFYSCYWLRPGTPYPADVALLERCTVDILKRYRNHPSLVLYMAMNEHDTKEDVYAMWRRHVQALDGTRWFIPSAYFPSDRKDMGDWFRQDLPTGMTDTGGTYGWQHPAWYFERVREGHNWMFMMECGSASLPPFSSLNRFLPGLQRVRTDGDLHYPLDAAWAHHGANQYYRAYNSALRRSLGEPSTVADYCWKGHVITVDQHRAMFEAVNHRMWDITSGLTQWKINACEPSVQWHTFDWFLKPTPSWYAIKKACEPLHVQLNRPDRKVAVINTHLTPRPDLQVRARVYDLQAKLLWDKTQKVDAPANHFLDCFVVPEPSEVSEVYFIRLDLVDAHGKTISENVYWLGAKESEDFRALQALPTVVLNSTIRFQSGKNEQVAHVTITNPTPHIAFLVQPALTRGFGGAEILPILWDDSYFVLFPGQSRDIKARFAASENGEIKPHLEIGGWNVDSEYHCLHLRASSQANADEPFEVQATILHTFLDGSRIDLIVDGRRVQSQYHAARGDQVATARFKVQLPPGDHILEVGRQKTHITVKKEP